VLELALLKPHHHDVGFNVNENDITNHRRAQPAGRPGVVRLNDLGVALDPLRLDRLAYADSPNPLLVRTTGIHRPKKSCGNTMPSFTPSGLAFLDWFVDTQQPTMRLSAQAGKAFPGREGYFSLLAEPLSHDNGPKRQGRCAIEPDLMLCHAPAPKAVMLSHLGSTDPEWCGH
jgi:hypothetical protein